MNITSILQELNLTKTEIKVYLALLQVGEATKATTVLKKTNLHKPNTYQALDSLHKKGFIATTDINDIKHFEAESVDKIAEVFSEKRRKLVRQEQDLKAIVNKYRNPIKKDTPTIIKNYKDKGVKTFLSNMLKELKKGDTLYSMGSSGDLMLENFKYYFPFFIKERVKKGIIFKGIFDTDDKPEHQTEIPPLTEAKFLESNQIAPMQTMIFKDKVAMFIFEEEMRIILIQNKLISSNYKVHFDLIWNSIKGKPLTSR